MAFVQVLVDLLMIFYRIVEAFVLFWIPLKYRKKDVAGQIALVTGAGGAIGRQLAIELAKLGCKVVCWDVDKEGTVYTALNNSYIVLYLH